MDIWILILLFIAISSALAAIISDNRLLAVLSLFISTLSIGLLYFHIGAKFVAVFQLLIYSGVLTVLFASISYLVEINQQSTHLKEKNIHENSS
jgi:NADH-quinone oxidoreductase subunit J